MEQMVRCRDAGWPASDIRHIAEGEVTRGCDKCGAHIEALMERYRTTPPTEYTRGELCERMDRGEIVEFAISDALYGPRRVELKMWGGRMESGILAEEN